MTAKCISFVYNMHYHVIAKWQKLGTVDNRKIYLQTKYRFVFLHLENSSFPLFYFIFFYKNTITGFCARHCGSMYKCYVGIAARTAISKCHSDDYIKSYICMLRGSLRMRKKKEKEYIFIVRVIVSYDYNLSYDYLCENYRMIFASEKNPTKRRTMIESIQSLKSWDIFCWPNFEWYTSIGLQVCFKNVTTSL